MKLITSLFFLFITLLTFGQTLEETQEWITQKIEANGLETTDTKQKYSVLFENTHMIIGQESIFIPKYDVQRSFYMFGIPIKDLTEVSFREFPTNVHMFLKTKNRQKTIEWVIVKEDGTKTTKLVSEVELVMGISLNDNDLKARLKKSINHLITLKGGTVAKEIF